MIEILHGDALEKMKLLKDKSIDCIVTSPPYWRLQSFPDWAFDRASKINSDSQLYKQAGNSVTVNVIKFIAERMRVEGEQNG